ncbi:MAG: mitochondrial fission ELM1 family protein [Acetobacteraceae bacterium]
MSVPRCWLLSEGYAGLQAQGLGLAEAAGLTPELRVLAPRAPWRFASARFWPSPLAPVAASLAPPLPDVAITCGGMGAVVGAALRARGERPGGAQSGGAEAGGRLPDGVRPNGIRVVQVQHPRMDPRRFDVVVVNRHDRLTGPNVIVTRTALHRVTQARLATAADAWRGVFAALPRPLVAVLVGGSNGRHRLDPAVGQMLAAKLAAMMDSDRVGLMLTPSRRTAPAVTGALADALIPRGAFVWDGSGVNPYFGMLALADAVVATEDSVSMVSEAVATSAPVLLAELPGRSRRIGQFTEGLLADGRVRRFTGRMEMWPAEPLDDTAEAGAEVRRRLGL